VILGNSFVSSYLRPLRNIPYMACSNFLATAMSACKRGLFSSQKVFEKGFCVGIATGCDQCRHIKRFSGDDFQRDAFLTELPDISCAGSRPLCATHSRTVRSDGNVDSSASNCIALTCAMPGMLTNSSNRLRRKSSCRTSVIASRISVASLPGCTLSIGPCADCITCPQPLRQIHLSC